jgi:hypothetical protein
MRAAFDALRASLQSITQEEAPSDVDGDEDIGCYRMRAVFVSDIHQGTAGCQADALLDFLKLMV